MQRKLTDYLIISLKGLAMGAADVVPGVSGGTIAFISGIYEELITSINNVSFSLLKELPKVGLAATWKKLNGNFLLALFIGIGISVLSLAKLIGWLLEEHPILVWSFFFGLVLASVWFVGKTISKWSPLVIGVFLGGAALAFFITSLPVSTSTDTLPYLFLSGALAICAMILPGISGAFILVLLGSYKTILDAVHERDLKIVAVVGAGAIIGLLAFSKVLKWMFNHYKDLTLALLSGFILGSLNKIWPWKKVLETKIIDDKVFNIDEMNVLPGSFEGAPQLLPAIGLALLGFVLILALEKWADQKPA
jgi:putative membrane protein